MKSTGALLAALLVFGFGADSSIAADTNSPSPWKFGPPHAADGYVLVRLEMVTTAWSGSEIGGRKVDATFHPIEFKYPGRSPGGGGGGFPGYNPFTIKPVETKIGKSFEIGLLNGNSVVPQSQHSIADLLEACADEKDPNHLKLDLILSIPAAEARDGQAEHDYSHWFIESIDVVEKLTKV